jgi:hypothetical protein
MDDFDPYGMQNGMQGQQGSQQIMISLSCCMFVFILVACIFFPQLFPFQLPWATTKSVINNFPFINNITGTPSLFGTTGPIGPTGTTGVPSTSTPGLSMGTGKDNDVCVTDSDCTSGCCTSAVSMNDGRPRCAPAGQCSNPVSIANVANMKWCTAANKGDAPWIQVYKHPKTGYAACIGNAPNTCTWRFSATDYKDLANIKKTNDSNGLKCTQVDIGNPNSWCFDAQATLDKNGAQTWKC